MVARVGGKLAGAGVNGLHDGADSEHRANAAHDLFQRAGETCYLRVREPHRLGGEQTVAVHARKLPFGDGAFCRHDVGHMELLRM